MISNPRSPAHFCLESFQLKDTSFVIPTDDWLFPRVLQQNARGTLFLGPHFDAAAETGYAEPAPPSHPLTLLPGKPYLQPTSTPPSPTARLPVAAHGDIWRCLDLTLKGRNKLMCLKINSGNQWLASPPPPPLGAS